MFASCARQCGDATAEDFRETQAMAHRYSQSPEVLWPAVTAVCALDAAPLEGPRTNGDGQAYTGWRSYFGGAERRRLHVVFDHDAEGTRVHFVQEVNRSTDGGAWREAPWQREAGAEAWHLLQRLAPEEARRIDAAAVQRGEQQTQSCLACERGLGGDEDVPRGYPPSNR